MPYHSIQSVADSLVKHETLKPLPVLTPEEVLAKVRTMKLSTLMRLIEPSVARNRALPDFRFNTYTYGSYEPEVRLDGSVAYHGCIASCVIAELANTTVPDRYRSIHDKAMFRLNVGGILQSLYYAIDNIRIGYLSYTRHQLIPLGVSCPVIAGNKLYELNSTQLPEIYQENMAVMNRWIHQIELDGF